MNVSGRLSCAYDERGGEEVRQGFNLKTLLLFRLKTLPLGGCLNSKGLY